MDRFLITKFEAFAHWFQKWTGRTNFWLLSLCAWMTVACMCGELFLTLTVRGDVLWLGMRSLGHSGFLIFLLYVCIVIMSREAIFGWRSMEQRAYARLARGLSNPEKVLMFSRCWRLFLMMSWGDFIFLDAVGHYTLSIELQAFAIAACAYLRACDPLPPCTGKLFERTPSLAEAACQS